MKNSKAKTILTYLGKAFNILLVLIVILNLYTIVAKLITKKDTIPVLGITSAIVDTGSMDGNRKGSIPAKSIIFLVKAREYRVDDVIMFQGSGKTPVTHRIIGIDEDGFITQGDANNAPDQDRVKDSQIYGKVFFKIPYIGYLIAWMKTPLGSMALVVVCFLLIGAPMIFKKEENSDTSDDSRKS